MVTTHSFYNYPLDAGGLVLGRLGGIEGQRQVKVSGAGGCWGWASVSVAVSVLQSTKAAHTQHSICCSHLVLTVKFWDFEGPGAVGISTF